MTNVTQIMAVSILALLGTLTTKAIATPQGDKAITRVAVGSFGAEVELGTFNKNELRLNWSHMLEDGTVLKAPEGIPLSFRPECTASIGNGRLAVGGRSHVSGNTVVQVLQLREPIVVLEFPTGKASLIPKGLSRVLVFQDDKSIDAKDVLGIAQLPKATASFMVLYASGHLWEFYLTGTPRSLISSTEGANGSITAPFTVFHAAGPQADHVDHGCWVIFLSSDRTQPDVLVLDTDRNGRIDSVTASTKQTRRAMYLYDESKRLP